MSPRRLAWVGLGVMLIGALLYAVRARHAVARLPDPALAPLLAHAAHWREIGRPSRAVQVYLKATQLDPEDAAGWVGLAEIAVNAGQPNNAQHAVARALQLQPSDADLLALQARAVALPPPPTSMRPGRPRAVTRRRCAAAQRMYARGRVDDALLALQAAAWLDERAARPYRDLANMYYLRGDLSDALVAQRNAVDRAPQSVPLRRNLAALEAEVRAPLPAVERD